VYGSESVVTTQAAYLTQGGKRYAQCRVAMYEFGEAPLDTEPGMVPDGAKCGVDKVRRAHTYVSTVTSNMQMCSNVHCVRTRDVLDVNPCQSLNCSDQGLCNNLGHCHCQPGYGGWNCASSGPGQLSLCIQPQMHIFLGGSPQSGPASNAGGLSMIGGLIIFLLVVVPVAVAIYCVYRRYCRHTRPVTKSSGSGGVVAWFRRTFTGTPSTSPSATPMFSGVAPPVVKAAPPMRSQVRIIC
jgi:hypothetical protein